MKKLKVKETIQAPNQFTNTTMLPAAPFTLIGKIYQKKTLLNYILNPTLFGSSEKFSFQWENFFNYFFFSLSQQIQFGYLRHYHPRNCSHSNWEECNEYLTIKVLKKKNHYQLFFQYFLWYSKEKKKSTWMNNK